METKYYRVRESYFTVVGERMVTESIGAVVVLRLSDKSTSLEFLLILSGSIQENFNLIKEFLTIKDKYIKDSGIYIDQVPEDNLSGYEKFSIDSLLSKALSFC